MQDKLRFVIETNEETHEITIYSCKSGYEKAITLSEMDVRILAEELNRHIQEL